MNAPATFYHVESPYVWRNIRERIKARKDELKDEMASGLVSDFEDYKYRRGVLVGLDEALHLIDELEKNERN
jgi:hypothetical protein